MKLTKNTTGYLAALALCFGVATANAAPIFTALDLSGVTNGSPNFVDQTFTQGSFSTQFDGTLQSTSGSVGTTIGNAAGDLAFGGASGSSVDYLLSFDDAVLLRFSQEVSIGFVTGPFDVWTLSSAGTIFTVEDNGSSDINVISNTLGSITFTGLNGGDEDWSITTSAIAGAGISFTNTAGGGNIGPFNIKAAAVSEPSTLALLFVGVLSIFGLGRRKAK